MIYINVYNYENDIRVDNKLCVLTRSFTLLLF